MDNIKTALAAAARRHGFTLADAAAAGIAFPTRPGRAGWADRWAVPAQKVIRKKAVEAAQEAAEAERRQWWAAQEAALAAQATNPVWRVEEERGSYSWANCLFGHVVRYGGGDMTKAEAEAEKARLNHLHAAKIERANLSWYAFLNG